MWHILVIDDDTVIRNLLGEYLSRHAFRVTGISNSEQLDSLRRTDPFDLLVVDLNLGHEDGLEIVRKFSSVSDAPIIIISGHRQEEADIVVGLELGAVDFIKKPFGMREFLARVRVSLRQKPVRSKKGDRRCYSFNGYVVNPRRRTIIRDNGEEIRLTAGQFNLLTVFVQRPRQVLSREQLLAACRIHGEEVFDRSVDVLILRLRRKLETNPTMPELFKTERGAGYIFDAEVKVERV